MSNLERALEFVGAFDRRWPAEDEIHALLAPDVRFIERPNLVNPAGSERDLEAILGGIEAGKKLFAWQSYTVRDHLAADDRVFLRMRWEGELGADAGPWSRGTVLRAWCVGHYRLANGLIAEIEQHDCYDPPAQPAG
jgi:hypothetical protein